MEREPGVVRKYVYVVIEILDPNRCYQPDQRQYVRYDEQKCLTIVGIYEDYTSAQAVCHGYGSTRHILTSEFFGARREPQPVPMDLSGY